MFFKKSDIFHHHDCMIYMSKIWSEGDLAFHTLLYTILWQFLQLNLLWTKKFSLGLNFLSCNFHMFKSWFLFDLGIAPKTYKLSFFRRTYRILHQTVVIHSMILKIESVWNFQFETLECPLTVCWMTLHNFQCWFYHCTSHIFIFIWNLFWKKKKYLGSKWMFSEQMGIYSHNLLCVLWLMTNWIHVYWWAKGSSFNAKEFFAWPQSMSNHQTINLADLKYKNLLHTCS